MEDIMQSPIDLDTKTAIGADLGPFTIENLFQNCFTTLYNTSETLAVEVPQDCYVSGGPLRARYKYEGLHFHWGGAAIDGSGHTMNGQKFLLEAHFVFKNGFKFRASEDVLDLAKTVADLKYKMEHPGEEKEAEEDEEEEEKEEEDEEGIKEKFALLTKKFEETQKNRMDEWNEQRIAMLEKERKNALGQKKDEGNKNQVAKNVSAAERKMMEDREIVKEIWGKFRHNVQVESNLDITEDRWADLFSKYEQSTEAKEYVKKIKKERASAVVKSPAVEKVTVPEEVKNAPKALKLEMECYSRQEWVGLEQAKPKYAAWIDNEIKIDKQMKNEMKRNFESYVEKLEERAEIEDDDEMPEAQKKLKKARWQLEDDKKEEELKNKLRQVIARRKKDVVALSTSQINGTVVVALLFKADPCTAPYEMFQYVSYIKEPFKKITIDGNLLMPFKPSLTNGEYFTYTGSRTICPYEENVNWIVIRDPMPILPQQVEFLRELKCVGGFITCNRREPLNLGKRELFYNKRVANVMEPPCPGKATCPCKAAQPQKHWTDFI